MAVINRRDEQIAAINARTDGLRDDRLLECRANIMKGYEGASVVDLLARVVELNDREPSDFRVLTNSEARPIEHFNDESSHWEMYCEALGRSIGTSERLHIFERLDQVPGEGEPLDAADPDLQRVLNGVSELRQRGFHPDTIIIPISLHGAVFRGLTIDIQTGSDLVLGDGTKLRIFWSNRVAPIDRFVILDKESGVWKVKLDPETKARLTVAIGRPPSPPFAVTFLAETVVKYEIVDPARLFVIEVQGIPSADLYAEGKTEKNRRNTHA